MQDRTDFLAPSRSHTAPAVSPGREEVFWRQAGVAWRHLAGHFSKTGFSFEWHESDTRHTVDWAKSFHPECLEICLNLQGRGWINAQGTRVDIAGEAVVFFGTSGGVITAERIPGEPHQFLSVEFSLPFLRRHLGAEMENLHPVLRRCLSTAQNTAVVSGVSPITQRQRDLLRSLLHPPVLRAAQSLWYQSKALEFAAEFLFATEEEPLCTRAQRVARERVAKAKAVLARNLEETPSLEALGREVGCSPFYLSRTFTQETGLTISQWLRRVRLERAAELLRSRKCNVTEAALQVGYSSLSHFSQAFRETFGCCPGLYPIQTVSQQPPQPKE